MLVTFVNERGAVLAALELPAGITVLEAARRGGVALETPCGGRGACGKCRARLASPVSPALAGTENAPPALDIAPCTTKVFGSITVAVPDTAPPVKQPILAHGAGFPPAERKPFIRKTFSNGNTQVYGGEALLGVEAGDTTGSCYGLALDIGTTTLAAWLVDLRSGRVTARETALNPQCRYAQDLISRILIASEPAGLETLYRAFMDGAARLIKAMTARTGIQAAHIYEAVYSGNTAMLHIAAKADPSSLGRCPYTPRLKGGGHITDPGLPIAAPGLIYLPPVVSGFVGADISAGAAAAGLLHAAVPTLFIDIGTNGEMAAARQGVITAASVPAGPAFEGMQISQGMRGEQGAVEAAAIDRLGRLRCRVIGGGKARGICGSGLASLIGALAAWGVIEESGRFAAPDAKRFPRALGARLGEKREKNRGGTAAFRITGDVYLTQQDVRQFQSAKAAVRGGVALLLEHAGIAEEAVGAVLIAGAFGYSLREQSLFDTGLLPACFAGKTAFVGNTALSGAASLLLNTAFREEACRAAGAIKPLSLAGNRRFEDLFIGFMSFPPRSRA